jgi:arylsulfatase A-like enzyme|tara:strand:+ start:257 stop:1627 length:1371 start_codon:yes stop_codon:yes gene_type:complete
VKLSFMLKAFLFLLFPITVLATGKPNIIFVMVDDAGTGDFSPYGGKFIKTPVMAKLAKEGMQFERAYSGSAVCGPTRCVVMTGLHPGHCHRRANRSRNGLIPLPADTPTVASMLKKAGYQTGGFGKWGLGNPETTGVPEKLGFDLWYGYYDQVHAHNYYPEYLIRNSKREELPENKNGKKGSYTHYLIEKETLKFIEENKDKPFFCYAAWTPPHGDYVIPHDDPNYLLYKDKSWSQKDKNYAGMVSLLDQGVGRIVAKLKELGIADNTLLIYTSDNGANASFSKTLKSNGILRGVKRSLYEGGIRAPFVAHWPGKIAPGSTSDLLTTHVDLMATAAELSGAKVPIKSDGISILPSLLGKPQKKKHEFLYFEIYEGAFQQSVRVDNWKGYRRGLKDPVEVYDLSKDPSEKNNIAEKHPEVAVKLNKILLKEHGPSPHFTAPDHFKRKKQGARKKAKK